MITDKEIEAFWNKWDIIILKWNTVSVFGVVLILPIPVSLILKYKFGVKGLWLLNDTADGDFGDPKELAKKGYENKPKWFKFVWWWRRNHSWNFISRYRPPWDRGAAEDFRIIKSTIIPEHEVNHPLRWTWCQKKGVHGLHYIAARINGKIVCRYSTANSKKEKLLGAGGDRYKLKIR